MTPPSDDRRPASNVAVSGLPATGDRPGKIGVAFMAMGGGSGGDAHASASTPDSYANPAASSPPISYLRTASRIKWVNSLFAHFIGSSEKRRRHGDAERLGGLEVDHQLELGGLLNR